MEGVLAHLALSRAAVQTVPTPSPNIDQQCKRPPCSLAQRGRRRSPGIAPRPTWQHEGLQTALHCPTTSRSHKYSVTNEMRMLWLGEGQLQQLTNARVENTACAANIASIRNNGMAWQCAAAACDPFPPQLTLCATWCIPPRRPEHSQQECGKCVAGVVHRAEASVRTTKVWHGWVVVAGCAPHVHAPVQEKQTAQPCLGPPARRSRRRWGAQGARAAAY